MGNDPEICHKSGKRQVGAAFQDDEDEPLQLVHQHELKGGAGVEGSDGGGGFPGGQAAAEDEEDFALVQLQQVFPGQVAGPQAPEA